MKKIYSLVILLILSTTILKAQILVADHPVTNYSGPYSDVLSASLDIKNDGTQQLNVLAENFSHSLVPGHYTYFCWKVCYDTSVTSSPLADYVTIDPGTTVNFFHDYVVANSPGHDEICYRFFDVNGLGDTLVVCFNYDFSAVGITEMTSAKNSFNISGPNPANTYTNISYSINGKMDARIVVSNMLGVKVNETKLSDKQNVLTVPVKDLQSGVYVYSLIVDGKLLSSKKLVVAHR